MPGGGLGELSRQHPPCTARSSGPGTRRNPRRTAASLPLLPECHILTRPGCLGDSLRILPGDVPGGRTRHRGIGVRSVPFQPRVAAAAVPAIPAISQGTAPRPPPPRAAAPAESARSRAAAVPKGAARKGSRASTEMMAPSFPAQMKKASPRRGCG
eukprot:gene14345-biopygen4027